MRVDDISIKFLAGTERISAKKKQFYEIEAENLETMEICTTCGKNLRRKDQSERIIYDYRPSPFTGVPHFYRLNLISQRYACTNPECGQTFTAGLLDERRCSRALSKYIVEKLLEKESNTYSDVAKEVPFSRSFISDVTKDFVKELNLRFSPSEYNDYLYLYEFNFQKKLRYCLIGVNILNEKRILGLFGYKDRITEFVEYLRFHLKDEVAYFVIATENPEQLEKDLLPYLDRVTFVLTQEERDALIENFENKYDYERHYYNYHEPYGKILNHIKSILKGPDSRVNLLRWWQSAFPENTPDQETRKHFAPLVKVLLEDDSFAYEYNKYDADFKKYKDAIKDYNREHISFERLALQLMYKEEKNHLFSDIQPESDYYDGDQDVIYRVSSRENTDKLKQEAKKRYELALEAEYEELPSEYYEYFGFTSYEDPEEELPESVIQEMASRSMDE